MFNNKKIVQLEESIKFIKKQFKDFSIKNQLEIKRFKLKLIEADNLKNDFKAFYQRYLKEKKQASTTSFVAIYDEYRSDESHFNNLLTNIFNNDDKKKKIFIKTFYQLNK